MRELERVVAATGDKLDVRVVVIEPEDADSGWKNSPLVQTVKSIPGTTVVHDVMGVESAAFHVTHSGHVVVYGSDGLLRFSGGLTLSKGHEGPSEASNSLEAIARGVIAEDPVTPVFGCQLIQPDWIETCGKGGGHAHR